MFRRSRAEDCLPPVRNKSTIFPAEWTARFRQKESPNGRLINDEDAGWGGPPPHCRGPARSISCIKLVRREFFAQALARAPGTYTHFGDGSRARRRVED